MASSPDSERRPLMSLDIMNRSRTSTPVLSQTPSLNLNLSSSQQELPFHASTPDHPDQIHWLDEDEEINLSRPHSQAQPSGARSRRNRSGRVNVFSMINSVGSSLQRFFASVSSSRESRFFEEEEAIIYEPGLEQMGDDGAELQGRDSTAHMRQDQLYRSYLGESIIMSFFSCCCMCTFPLSLMAIYFSSRVDSLLHQKKTRLAVHYSRIARAILLVSLIVTLILYILFIVFAILLLQPL